MTGQVDAKTLEGNYFKKNGKSKLLANLHEVLVLGRIERN